MKKRTHGNVAELVRVPNADNPNSHEFCYDGVRTRLPRMKKRKPGRKGFALILVLGLLALTLGAAYALLRTNTVDHELQRNQSRRSDARAAAQAGMSVALRKLFDNTWSGADTTFTGALDSANLQGFTVTYATGDSALTSSSSDWQEYPFRLTITSEGYAIDPNNPSARSKYTIRVVTQMIRRKLNTNMALSGLESFSIYQSSNSPARIQHPVRINGNFGLQGELEFSRSYPQGYRGTEYFKFFDELIRMRNNGVGDYRPFTGVLFTPATRQPSGGDVPMVLEARLGVPRVNVNTTSSSPVPELSSFSGYRLYDKGKQYSAQSLPVQPDSSDVVPDATYLVPAGTYTADVQSNPLGIYTCTAGSVGISSSTTFNGVLLAYGSGGSSDVHIAGNNVAFSGKILPAISGDSTNYRLPAMMTNDDIRIHDGSNRTIEGWVIAGDEFQVRPGASSSAITVTGGVFCGELYLDGRSGWVQTEAAWDAAYDAWDNAWLKLGINQYFPGWLMNNRSWGVYLTPRLIFNPTPSGVMNWVPDSDEPIYVAHPDDGGLQWDIVRWQESGS